MFSPKIVLMLLLAILGFSIVYFFLGRLTGSTLSYNQYLVFTSLVAVVIVGGYQLYFWVQENSSRSKVHCLKMKLDDYIPFWPKWIWIYSFLYFPTIGFTVVTIKSIEEGVNIIFGGLILLLVHVTFFYFFPTELPKELRQYKAKDKSSKFLSFIQSIDKPRNCFPSMHCSVAMYIAMFLFPFYSFYAFIFVALIVLSCLFTKQHGIADTIPGLFLGWLAFVLAF